MQNTTSTVVVSTFALTRGQPLPEDRWRKFETEPATHKVIVIDDFTDAESSRGPEDFHLDSALAIVEPADLVSVRAGALAPRSEHEFRLLVPDCRWILIVDTEIDRADIWARAVRGCLSNTVPIFSAVLPYPGRRPSALEQLHGWILPRGTAQ